ncbi:sulfatase-like hydrolase/transferase [Oricola sp.]|uniref:sulfatase-like hydrolase/transferase n=1 Tax=Oricola sp. TaxID=1979950 RepID=UPI0025F97184|nr:sulfatase-like hydrolase/transferase [Oricola sp.]MCI5076874.1 sulfatase-like hydrolase/transferase [Oricola sp.]
MNTKSKIGNVLYIMCDQLRFDYLSCYGHEGLDTPNIDLLASEGTRFTRAYVQSPICGPSRMSSYTGRYPMSHGSIQNGYPLRIGEKTLGDHLRPLGVEAVLIGKTHMRADVEGMERLGVAPDSIIGARLSECGFDAFERDDGVHARDADTAYNSYLRDRGYPGENPWHDAANSVASASPEETGSGWFLKYSNRAAKVAEEDSETPYLTRRFVEFLDAREGRDGWLCHLSFIKPHWPYIVPAPYHDMFGPGSWRRPVRSEKERENPHPVFAAFMEHRVSESFRRDEVRETVLPSYMGLIKQIDDQMGVLFAEMQKRGQWDNTLIVLTSDHGDYLGDHWLGEKDFFHEPAVKVPLVIRDPRGSAVRGRVCDALVEAIDLAPTFVEAFGGQPAYNWLEGRSLMPLLEGERPESWRQVAFSEYDYAMQPARESLGQGISECKIVMACDDRWKLIYFEGFRPMLFDLDTDPDELNDLGDDPDYEAHRQRLTDAIFAWSRRERQRVTITDEGVLAGDDIGTVERGILIGFWDEEQLKNFRKKD